MAISLTELQKIVESAFPDSEVEVEDLVGDGEHLSLYVKSSVFNGKTRVEQHRMVYNVLGELLGNRLHALALQTDTKD